MSENDGLPLFRARVLEVIASKMNNEAHRGISYLEGNIFQACVRGTDGSNYAIFATYPESLSEEDRQILDDISRSFDPEIQRALKIGNPMKVHLSRAAAVALWHVANLFKIALCPPFFRLNNGTLSPIYLDIRALSGHPVLMNLLCSCIQVELEMNVGPGIKIVLGGETAGIPFAYWVSGMTNISAGIVRKDIKDHGTKQGIEGAFAKGDKVAIIEDIITGGGSKEVFIKNAQSAGLDVVAVIVVFDRQQGGGEFLENQFGVPLISLTDMDIFLEIGKEMGYIDGKAYNQIMEYLSDPQKWNEKIAAQN